MFESNTNRDTRETFAASVNLTLTCTDNTVVNQNWTIGQIYSQRDVRCSPVDVTVTAPTYS